MGALLTKSGPAKNKIEVEVLPTMPTTSATPSGKHCEQLDPRSPNPFRTPISDLQFNEVKPLSKAQDLTNIDNISTSTTTTPTKLKTKLLRDLGYTLDPRSPALNFDRTPLNLSDLNMTDDFSLAGLSLNETDLQTPVKEKDTERFYTPVVEVIKLPRVEIDPRSPSIDIERTPLHLNSLADESQEIEEHINLQPDEEQEEYTPTIETTDAAVITETIKNMIYMDNNEDLPMTPKSDNKEKNEGKRTPLSCLINTQGVDNRMERRMLIQNKNNLARTIFKDAVTSGNHNSSKSSTSSSKIPVFRRSFSKELN